MSGAPHVTVLSLGGTISSAPPADGRLARPALSAADLVAAVPALERVAEIEVRDVRRLPSNDMTFAIARTVADEIRAAVGRGAAGVVVTQGTDTIEEMAYAWDLLVAGDAPTVVTGAMRHAALASADGAGNLLAAVRTASNRFPAPSALVRAAWRIAPVTTVGVSPATSRSQA